jgi:starch phosphorylase
MQELERLIARTRIAYLSMEIALRPEIHTYSGGLGILAGDTVRSCADLGLPVVFVTLASRQGYLRQEIGSDGRQRAHPDPWEPGDWAKPLPPLVAVEIEGRQVWIRTWLYLHRSPHGQAVPVLLLDTALEQNDARDRGLTDRLYGGDLAYRLKQEMVLGVGAARALRALGFELATYHLNEGHAALLASELLRRYPRSGASGALSYDAERVRTLCVFTTHTPVPAGHDRFPYGLLASTTSDLPPLSALKRLAGRRELNMTHLALALSGYVNGVAQLHAVTTRGMFPGHDIRAITNGVHLETWAHPAFARLLAAHFPRWALEPEILVRADHLPDAAVWAAHRRAKADLCRLVGKVAQVQLDPAKPIIGFARRMTGYKRPELLFEDIRRLTALAARHEFQLVFAGKAHPKDRGGQELIRLIHRDLRRLANRIPGAFLPNYDMGMARTVVAGCDVWLNTPIPPLEASGTSGMKAALNGVLNLSTRDGWWIEGCIEGSTGWSIAPRRGAGDAEALYERLENAVLPLYYEDRARWTWMMKQAIGKVACFFNSHRMMRRYASEAYLR